MKLRDKIKNPEPRSLSEVLKDKDKEILELKKEIDRLNEYVQNLEIIETNHQKLNGELHREIAKLKVANKQLEDKVLEIHRPINREER
jgi:polyhydroxyalkanoate synthesis regulator phasin|tara:strand:+ start:452 stop:715 length:264 start_codon:yes stop_codon:yes gene_type:complete